MQAFDQSTHDQTAASPQHPLEDEKKQQILHELENILESRFFRSAGRSKQFLRFVVQHKLDGHSELLNERTVVVEVFERPHDYATGDDPVVRVQAGEVRRRLHEYYQAAPTEPSVHIELPIGSYSPLFREGAPAVPLHTPPLHPPAPEPDAQKKKRRIIGRWAIVAMASAKAEPIATIAQRPMIR